MKPIFLIAATVFATLFSKAQTTEMLYGFHQSVSPGAKKSADIDASGRIVKNQTSDVSHYIIYLATFSKMPIYPIQLWINGEAFSVKIEAVEQVPVIQTHSDTAGGKRKPLLTLKAGQQLFQLTPVPLIADKSSGKAKALASKNAAVLYYKKAGKFQYRVLKKFTELAAPALQ